MSIVVGELFLKIILKLYLVYVSYSEYCDFSSFFNIKCVLKRYRWKKEDFVSKIRINGVIGNEYFLKVINSYVFLEKLEFVYLVLLFLFLVRRFM